MGVGGFQKGGGLQGGVGVPWLSDTFKKLQSFRNKGNLNNTLMRFCGY